MEHEWHKKHFSKPTMCKACSKLIWGLGKQGFECQGTIAQVACYRECAAHIKISHDLLELRRTTR